MNNWILQVRTLDGKLKNTFHYNAVTAEEMESVKRKMERVFPSTSHRLEVLPATKKVVSLMTGEEIEIKYDTPIHCDPSRETYWSM